MEMATKTAKRTKAQQALEIAREAAATAKDWRDFWNVLFGITGQLTELFPTCAQRDQFAKTEEHAAIMALLEQLQADEENHPEPPPDAKGRFVLRLPKSLHAALTAEAKAEGVSLNQLCVAKLATRLGKTVTSG
jgi:predicted HicB family RNase H-like nuclease